MGYGRDRVDRREVNRPRSSFSGRKGKVGSLMVGDFALLEKIERDRVDEVSIHFSLVFQTVRTYRIRGSDTKDSPVWRHQIAAHMGGFTTEKSWKKLVVPARGTVHEGIDSQLKGQTIGGEWCGSAIFDSGGYL